MQIRLRRQQSHQYAWPQQKNPRLAQQVAVSCAYKLIQISTRAQLHHNVHCVLFCVALDILHDVGMIQGCQYSDLVLGLQSTCGVKAY